MLVPSEGTAEASQVATQDEAVHLPGVVLVEVKVFQENLHDHTLP